jgi:hypothetical protein
MDEGSILVAGEGREEGRRTLAAASHGRASFALIEPHILEHFTKSSNDFQFYGTTLATTADTSLAGGAY